MPYREQTFHIAHMSICTRICQEKKQPSHMLHDPDRTIMVTAGEHLATSSWMEIPRIMRTLKMTQLMNSMSCLSITLSY